VRWIVPALAVIVLIAIGTAEGLESASELADLPGRGRPTLGAGGTALTLAGLALSIAVYAALGWYVARSGQHERDAVRLGVLVGLMAGLVGGSIRALLIRDYVDDTVAGFGLPITFATAVLVVFVVLAVLVSGVSGSAITWLSFRYLRTRSPRPRA
jgi:hypothetical protein